MCKLIAITNRKLCKENFLDQIKVLAEANVDQIILREKDLTPKEYEELAKQVLEICEPYHTECILHNYIDVAVALKQTKIHLPFSVFLDKQALLKDFHTIGCSIHKVEEMEKIEQYAEKEKEQKRIKDFYMTAGHIFKTDCKRGLAPRGLDFLEQMCNKTSLPVYAIGGITPENTKLVFQHGAKGACLMSWCMQATKEEIVKLQKNISK